MTVVNMPETTPCFRVKDLQVSYGDRTALSGLNLEIKKGELLGLVGPSGCGKTTFLSCLNRMIDLAGARVTGTIHFQQQELTAPDCDVVALRRRVGMIFQNPNPFPLSIRRNLTFPLAEHGLRKGPEQSRLVEESLQRVGLWDEVHDRLDESALKLSGGQQQRLCIARALVLDPEVLLLDEPCNALDPLASTVVEQLLLDLRGDYTLVVVTHNLAQARRLADRVAVFWTTEAGGTIVEVGRRHQIFENPRTEITARYVGGKVG